MENHPSPRKILRRCELLLLWLLASRAEAGSAWPEFRGPSGDGRSDAAELPLAWNESENVVWKTPIHGRGWSTPVVLGDQVWLTTATPDGRRLSAIAVDRESGRVLRDLLVFEVESPEPLGNPVNAYASPSPVIEEGRVYVHFGSYGTACLDTATGKVLWERRDLPCRHFRGPGSSPILHRGLLVLTFDGFDVQYITALDSGTGKTVWRTDRSVDFKDLDGDLRKAYSTPLIVDAPGGLQLVSCGSKAAYAYEPLTGKELWMVRYGGFSNASRPVAAGGLVLLNTGFGKADLWGVRLDGRGDVTESSVVWKFTGAAPLKPSPVAGSDLVFLVHDTGIVTCLEAKTGAQVWKARIEGEYSASPVLAAGRIYAPSEDGSTTVLRAGRRFEVLSRNRLEGGFMASPAIAGKSLFLRSRTHLYRIEDRVGGRPAVSSPDLLPAAGRGGSGK